MKYSILIVDDEPELLEILTSEFSKDGWVTSQAIHGQQALQMVQLKALEGRPFDVILSDFHMPILNGLELLKTLRQEGFKTPFIFFSGYGDKTSTSEAIRWGAADFLDKPFRLDSLKEKVKSIAAGVASSSASS